MQQSAQFAFLIAGGLHVAAVEDIVLTLPDRQNFQAGLRDEEAVLTLFHDVMCIVLTVNLQVNNGAARSAIAPS